jgi:hypothetical protein
MEQIKLKEEKKYLFIFFCVFQMDRLLPDGSTPRYGNNQTRSMFTAAEDRKLIKLVSDSGRRPNWRAISIIMKTRTPRQCRERYQNYLSPSIEHMDWTQEEDNIILEKFGYIGPKWNLISKFLNGRTGNSIRNRFQSIQRRLKKLEKMSKASSAINESPKHQPLSLTDIIVTSESNDKNVYSEKNAEPIVIKHKKSVLNQMSLAVILDHNPPVKLPTNGVFQK